jgi:hypothetical protein
MRTASCGDGGALKHVMRRGDVLRWDRVERVSIPWQADHDAAQLDKSLEKQVVILLADDHTAVARQPRDGALDPRASTISVERACILACLSTTAYATWAGEIPTLSRQTLRHGVAVVGSIGDQRRGPCCPRDVAQDGISRRDLSRRSRHGFACEWNSLVIRHHRPWFTPSAFGFSNA